MRADCDLARPWYNGLELFADVVPSDFRPTGWHRVCDTTGLAPRSGKFLSSLTEGGAKVIR